ncbi:hypothetical protein AGOR_G00210660 [Albula goreensis]|uniref:D-ribitol-5-phosphate cytidylyltransferase n=1 Tax=Albula goreensis TaxID=1534307 RepID=A0A8T3CRC0_9TELE|nr:hypothetical protein AGOR_G00210660 [Albula goreensis]
MEADSNEQISGSCSIDFTVAVVLPAGGSGERTGLSTPKQFCTFLNRPLISYTIQAFERVGWIEHIVVVVAKDNLDLMVTIVQQFGHNKVKVVLGGSTRHRSIFNGLKAFEATGEECAPTKPKVVIIHDAVRPFVEEDFLVKIAVAAKEQGAAGAVRPLVSTVIATTSEGYLDHSLERSKYRASEMPQGFLYDIIYQAYLQCSEADFEFGTECLHLALQYCGTNARLIEGPPTLWKVTYKRDLFAAESIIKESGTTKKMTDKNKQCSGTMPAFVDLDNIVFSHLVETEETLSQTACVVTGVCEESVQLAHALQKTLGAQDMQVDVVSTLLRSSGTFNSKNWNFIHVAMNSSCLADLGELVKTFEETGYAVLNPVVLILVHLDVSEQSPTGERAAVLGGVRDLATEAKQRNILLYGILLNHVKDAEQREEAVQKLSQIIMALIKERNPALTGQLLWV